MIMQETRIKTSSGHKAVSKHVLSGPKNETIRVLSGSDYLLKDWMKEAKREGIRYGLRHIAFNPAKPMTDEQLASFAERFCVELSADPERMTLVIHQKDGSTHGHLLLPEWQEDHVLSSKFTWQRLEKLARLEELRLRHTLVPGRHDRAIAKALREAGNSESADRVAALVPEDNSAHPVSAYTSQARRMTERQAFDLPAARCEIMTFWEKSGNKLKTFRRFFAVKNWHMRSGDRTDGRRSAHIIETDDGMLIGSFTRLTKVRTKDFRLLLEEEASRPSPVDLRPVVRRLEQQERRHRQREERKHVVKDLIWVPPASLSALDRQRLLERGQSEVAMLRKRLPALASPRSQDQSSEGFRIYLKDWKQDMKAAGNILNARHPLERRYGPDSPLDIQSECIVRMMKEGWSRLKQAQQTIARLERLHRLSWSLPEDVRIAVRDLKRQGLLQMALRKLDRFYDRDTPVSPTPAHRSDVNR